MAYLERVPELISKDIVRSFYFFNVDQSNSGIMVEDGCFELMFINKTQVQIKTGFNKVIDLPKYFGIGKVALPYRFLFPDSLGLFAIKFQPWVSSYFFEKSVFSGIYSVNASIFPDLHALHERLFLAKSPMDMIKVAENYLGGLKLPPAESFDLSKSICERIEENKGLDKVATIMDSLPFSRQRINKLFYQNCKSSIKEYSTLVRIRALLAYYAENRTESLTNLAFQFDYFDQSHFIKDFRKVTGVSPSEFFGSENLTSSQLEIRKDF